MQLSSGAEDKEEPQPSQGLRFWNRGEPEAFRLRCGPNYRWLRRKARPGAALYRCISADVLEAPRQIHSALADYAGTSGISEACPPLAEEQPLLPEVVLVHFQLPFEAGPLYGEHPQDDNGCSVLLWFVATPSTRAMDEEAVQSCPGTKLLARYFREEGHPFKEGSLVSGCLKVVGILENPEDLEVPGALRPIVRRFNGKPVLVERESRRYWLRGRPGVVELSINIRGFNPVARSMLRRLRGQLTSAVIQLGILVQGCSDDELPELLLGTARLAGLDLLAGREVEVLEECWEDCREYGGLGELLLQRLRKALRCPGRARQVKM